MIKKILAWLLTAALIGSLASCGPLSPAEQTAERALCLKMDWSEGPGLDISAESGRIDPAVMDALTAMGYIPKKGIADYDITLGGIAAILPDEDGFFYAGADHRRTYKALAY